MTYEEAVEAINLKKAALKDAKTALRAFRKENDINPDDEIADEKLAKKHGKLVTSVEKAETELTEATDAAKELKPKAERAVKYDYPPEMSAGEKKKFRAKARAAAKKAAKGETEAAEAPAKPAKKAKAEVAEEVAEEVPAKPTKKKKAVQADED